MKPDLSNDSSQTKSNIRKSVSIISCFSRGELPDSTDYTGKSLWWLFLANASSRLKCMRAEMWLSGLIVINPRTPVTDAPRCAAGNRPRPLSSRCVKICINHIWILIHMVCDVSRRRRLLIPRSGRVSTFRKDGSRKITPQQTNGTQLASVSRTWTGLAASTTLQVNLR